MSKEWKKTGIKVQTVMDNGDFRARGFNNLSAEASDDAIQQFALVIGQLTGEEVAETDVTVTNELTSEA